MHVAAGAAIASGTGRSQRCMQRHVSAAADDRFARLGVAELTIELATQQSSRSTLA